MTVEEINFQPRFDKKELMIQNLKTEFYEVKKFLESVSKTGRTDKDPDIAEMVHWHNQLDDLLEEVTRCQSVVPVKEKGSYPAVTGQELE